LLVGEAWSTGAASRIRAAVRVEGTENEVRWLVERVEVETSAAGCSIVGRLPADEAGVLWSRQVEFSDRGARAADNDSPFVVKISVPSSAITSLIAKLVAFDADCTVQAHAASGIITARFSKFTQADLSRVIVAELRPAAIKLGGSLVIVRSKLEGLTPHLIWGNRTEATMLLERVKQKFDPKNILNPGRFVVS
jgi:FAD/FMN-containing dehydrogenase